MAALALKFLGDLEIARGSERVELPPSRKTRALLAYLALTGRAFRREHLCELLWEIPDDPRGSLRWSLSKLRRLVDDDIPIFVGGKATGGMRERLGECGVNCPNDLSEFRAGLQIIVDA